MKKPEARVKTPLVICFSDNASQDAASSFGAASTMMIGGLIIAIIIGLAAAIFITRSITGPIRKIIEGLKDGAEQVTSASGQVSSASQSLAEGSSEQAASLEEMNAQANQMMDFVEDLVRMVGGSSQGGDGLRQLKQSAHQALTSRKMLAGLAGKASKAKAALSRKAAKSFPLHDDSEDDFRDF